MTRQMTILLLVAVLALAVVGLLWAQNYGQGGSQAMSTSAAKSPAADEYGRCMKTCNTLMDYYHKQYAEMKTHEGDKTCWSNCQTRFGTDKSASTADQKSLWMSRMPMNMRANQCAQSCWRTHHSDNRVVSVAGWRSEPRSNTVCYR